MQDNTNSTKKKKKKERRILGLPLEMLLVMTIFVGIGLYIQRKAATLMFVQQDYWKTVQGKFRSDSIRVPATRGKLLSCDGRVMVASLPEFRLAMDFVVVDKDTFARNRLIAWRDSALAADMDSLTEGLAAIFPERSAKWFRERIEEGKRKKSRSWDILKGKRANYLQKVACKQLPYLREKRLKSGFIAEPNQHRVKVYGSLASRTLGGVYRDSNAGKTGLEKCYDSILRGVDGYSHREKVRDRYLTTIDVKPKNGHDLLTTIDIRMQDIVEKALRDKLTSLELDNTLRGAKISDGVAILMEVATGDVKAIVSLSKVPSATSKNGFIFREETNNALNALWEPGSTFKVGSMMVAMEHGYVTPDTYVDCEGGPDKPGKGVKIMHGSRMTDHKRGGYGDLTVSQVLEQSSNIGVSKIIDQYYYDNPERYVQALYDMGVGIPLGMPMGTDPIVRMPKKNANGRGYSNWSKTTLPWMSIGYECQLPPISTLAFYNAIANNGKFVRPRFVKAELENGKVVREFPVEVIKEKICSDKTIKNAQLMLERVVSRGLGSKAGNPNFKVSGKTGTAQRVINGSYAGRNYMVTFCGYFPSDAPKYSCIVCITEQTPFPSGGGHCGPVFSTISRLVMNDGSGRDVHLAGDSLSTSTPTVAAGNVKETGELMKLMKIDSTPEPAPEETPGVVPDVTGMGARDAVERLQALGLKVKLHGQGHVAEQTIKPGTKASGQTITLNLK